MSAATLPFQTIRRNIGYNILFVPETEASE
jgi:hypothetical protein